jgi:hypothetical protein
MRAGLLGFLFYFCDFKEKILKDKIFNPNQNLEIFSSIFFLNKKQKKRVTYFSEIR